MPTKSLSPLQQTLLLTGTVLALLATAAILAVLTTTVTGSEAFGLVAAVSGGTALAGGLAISPATPTTNLIPHTVLILAVLAMTVALTLQHVWTGVEVTGIFGFITGGGIMGAGSGVAVAEGAKVAAAKTPQPVPELPAP